MLQEFLSTVLTKAQIQTFLQLPHGHHERKDLLARRLWQQIEADAREKERLLDSYPLALAVGPSELERMLQCTPSERRRWVEQGKIPVLALRGFQKAGRVRDYAVHDRRVVEAIDREMIALWRLEHQREVILHRQLGGKISSARRQARVRVREQLLQRFSGYNAEWDEADSPDLLAVLRLCYWLLWACSMVNVYVWKAQSGRKYLQEYIQQRDLWVQRKCGALQALARTAYSRLAFFYPAELDQYEIWLCEEHSRLQEHECYDEVEVFFLDYREAIEQCQHCLCQRNPLQKAYYYLEIRPARFPSLCFAFHLPYEYGQRVFPAPDLLPIADIQEMDGTLCWGQELLNTQAGIFSEDEILTHLQEAMAKVEVFYPVI
jgi:hypothetical protein